jgi:hypothetical protein
VKKPAKKKSAKKPAPKKAAQKGSVETKDGTLTGWPTIAKYLGQPIAVAHRWAKSGMPVERKGRSMTAKPDELSNWLSKESGTKAGIHIAQASDEDLLADLRRGLQEARKAK